MFDTEKGVRIKTFQVPNNAPCPLRGMPNRITAVQADMTWDPITGALYVEPKDKSLGKPLIFCHGAWLEPVQ